MRKYIVFRRGEVSCIEAIKVDFLKLKASYPKREFEIDKESLSIRCDEFEVRYISIWKSGLIKRVQVDEISGVFDSHLLGLNDINQERYSTLENNEFLVWLREGGLVL